MTDTPAFDAHPWEQAELDAAAAASGSGGSGGEEQAADPDAWILRPEWTGGDEVWTKWPWHSETGDEESGGGGGVKAEGHHDDDEGDDDDGDDEGDEEDDDESDDFALDDDNFPPWAKKDAGHTAHLKNNLLRSGERGTYGTLKNGQPVFQAHPEFGSRKFEPGLGRKRGRTRGKGSVVKQKGKRKNSKGKDKGKNGPQKGDKGKGNGKGKGKHIPTAAAEPAENGAGACAKQALNAVESALQGQNKLIDLLVAKEGVAAAKKEEDDDGWRGWCKKEHWGRSSGSNDRWW